MRRNGIIFYDDRRHVRYHCPSRRNGPNSRIRGFWYLLDVGSCFSRYHKSTYGTVTQENVPRRHYGPTSKGGLAGEEYFHRDIEQVLGDLHFRGSTFRPSLAPSSELCCRRQEEELGSTVKMAPVTAFVKHCGFEFAFYSRFVFEFTLASAPPKSVRVSLNRGCQFVRVRNGALPHGRVFAGLPP